METKLTMDQYQAEAMSFRLESAGETYALLGLSAEVGELHSLVSKALRDGRKFDYELNVKKELGDVLWNLAAIAADNGHSLSDIGYSNIAKLSSRKANNTIQGSGDNR